MAGEGQLSTTLNTTRISGAPVGVSELVSALSYALDLAEGQPAGHSARTCLIGMRIGDALHVNPEVREALYYALLLKDAGSSANAGPIADLFGSDDRAVKQDLKTTDWTRLWDVVPYAVRNAGRGQPPLVRLHYILRIAKAGPRRAREFVRMRAERGAAIALRLGFPQATAEAIHALDEHWDGRGHPDGGRGETIPLPARIALLAQTVDVFHVQQDLEAAFGVARRRSGTWFDPSLVDVLCAWRDDLDWWSGLLRDDLTKRIAAIQPADRGRHLDERGIDDVAEAFAEIIDAKTPFTHRNSLLVARWATAIARKCGVGPSTERRIYRAALLHDVGNLGVSNRILMKPGRLTPDDHREIERHPIYTWEILSRVTALRDLAWTASLHHERLDGSGYPRGLDRKRLDLPARILAVADAYVAMISNRPHRESLPPEVAVALLLGEGGDDRFDARVVQALAHSLRETLAAPASVT